MTTNQTEDANDEFEDAVEALESDDQPKSWESTPPATAMNLEVALLEMKEATRLFFNNQFDEAKAMMEPWSATSFYHAMGSSVFAFQQAVLTFEHKDMEAASEVVKHSIELSNQSRRKNTVSESFGRLVKKPDYDSFTEEQVHAELCYAESLLFKAVLTFTEDETLISFVKGGLKIRSCYQSYKECWHILNHRRWADDRHKQHFESGVRLGAGAFNLLISLLPQRILKLLEFIGFHNTKSSRETGLRELELGYQLEGSVRRIMCALVLLNYHLVVLYVLGTSEGNLVQASAILEEQLKLNPISVWFLFFKGRLQLVQGRVDEAIVDYKRSWKSQDIWPQFHHFCYWELMWAHSYKLDWKSAGEYSQRLLEESRWSKCIYTYQRAAFMCMLKEEEGMSTPELAQLSKLFKDAPSLKQRIAGKSLPMEKFVVKKCARFFAQNERLCLPVLELMYVWNGFRIVGKNWTLIQNCYRLVERTVKDLERRKKDKFYWDDLALCLLLKGVCLRYMGSPLLAEESFLVASKMDKHLVEDHYLVPFSVAELGFLYQSLDRPEEAVVWLEAAKNNYKGYSLESRLHFRLHFALTQLRSSTPTDRPAGDVGVAASTFEERPSVELEPDLPAMMTNPVT